MINERERSNTNDGVLQEQCTNGPTGQDECASMYVQIEQGQQMQMQSQVRKAKQYGVESREWRTRIARRGTTRARRW